MAPRRTDIYRPLRLPIASSQREAVAADPDISAAHDLRVAAFQEPWASASSSPDQKISLVIAYARALALVVPHCRHLEFNWGDSFHPETMVTGSIHLERFSVIFNIGALYSQTAVAQDLFTQSGLEAASQACQNAAGAFKWLLDSGIAVQAGSAGAVSTDLKAECLMMLQHLMMAQAQDSHFHMAVANKRSPSLLSKLAKQTYVFYMEAYKVICTSALQNEFNKIWVPHIKMKKSLFCAEACYSFSRNLHEDEELGEEISYLNIALSILADDKERPTEVYASSFSHAKKLEDNIRCDLRKANHQNARFYKMPIPDGKSVEALPSLCDVKPKLTEYKGLFPSVMHQAAKCNSVGIETTDNIMGKKQLQKCKGGTPSTNEKGGGKKILIPGRRRLCKQFSEPYCSDSEKGKSQDLSEWHVHKDCFMLKPMGNKIAAALKIPSEVFINDLADYQRDGIKWLWNIHCKGNGGILADDMGLGKTRQVSVFLVALFRSLMIKRVLILAPTSVLNGWTSELENMGINMPVKLFCSGDPSRHACLQTIIAKGGVLLTTYSSTLAH